MPSPGASSSGTAPGSVGFEERSPHAGIDPPETAEPPECARHVDLRQRDLAQRSIDLLVQGVDLELMPLRELVGT